LFDLLAGSVENGHAFAGEIDVAFAINGHAVGAEVAKELLVGQRTVALDFVGVGYARANVGNVEGLAVRRADDAVG